LKTINEEKDRKLTMGGAGVVGTGTAPSAFEKEKLI
jgi:hypothetical protein